MTEKERSYVSSMSDAAVKAKTGRGWAGWFAVLDKAGASELDHKAIVTLLSGKYGVPSWWRQMLTVEYERARGMRVRHETARGFSVAISKTVAASLPNLYAATAKPSRRRKWFPKGAFEPSSQTEAKYFRGAWNGSARLEMGFYAKDKGKAQIAVQVSKLKTEADVQLQRQAWKAALLKLQGLIED